MSLEAIITLASAALAVAVDFGIMKAKIARIETTLARVERKIDSLLTSYAKASASSARLEDRAERAA